MVYKVCCLCEVRARFGRSTINEASFNTFTTTKGIGARSESQRARDKARGQTLGVARQCCLQAHSNSWLPGPGPANRSSTFSLQRTAHCVCTACIFGGGGGNQHTHVAYCMLQWAISVIPPPAAPDCWLLLTDVFGPPGSLCPSDWQHPKSQSLIRRNSLLARCY